MEGIIRVSHIAGTIALEEKARLKKLIFRATRGKALTYFRDFSVPSDLNGGKEQTKAVYIVVF